MLVSTGSRTVRVPLLLLGISEFLILFSALYVGKSALDEFGIQSDVEYGSLYVRSGIFAVVFLLSLVAMGLYNFHQRIYYHEMMVRVFVGFLGGTIFLAAVLYFVPAALITQELAVAALMYAVMLIMLAHCLFLSRVDENIFRHRTLVYGAGKRASAISDLRRKADRRGFKIVGIVPAPGDEFQSEESKSVYATNNIEKLATELQADEIVIAMDDRRGNLPVFELLNCKLRGISVIEVIEFLERETGKIRLDLVNPGWLIFSSGFRISTLRRVIKRTSDVIAALAILLLATPLMLLTALAIKLEDGIRSPVFYRQKRVGYRGEVFELLKFRSMKEDAERDGQAVWATENDPRMTRIGRCLRVTRLDELPQMLNVLTGKMSIVGPRPERPEFVDVLAKCIPYYSERHTMKPGITGWAQIQYSYGASEDDALEKLQYDLFYVKNHNFMLDLMVILQTAEVVMLGKGAR